VASYFQGASLVLSVINALTCVTGLTKLHVIATLAPSLDTIQT